LKFFATARNSNVDKTISDDEEPVSLCNYTDVYYNDRITPDLAFMMGSATPAEIEKFQLKRDHVIITKDSEEWDDIGIPALVVEDMPEVLCGYHLSILEPGPELDGGFLAWLCRSDPLNNQFKLGANGVTRYGLGQYPLKNAFVALPPLDTQKRTAAFLDEKMARIDGLIEKKRALLDRLAEKRQAIITQAVTKGLNPAAPMKDSGIDWLGQIPAHWETLPLRRVARRVVTGRTPPGAAGDYFADGEIPWFTPGDFNGGLLLDSAEKALQAEAFDEGLALRYPPNSVLLVGIGATLGKVAVATVRCSSNQQINAIILEAGNNPVYLAYFLHAVRPEVRITASGNTLPILNQDKTKSLIVLRPPSDEQQKIADLLAENDRGLEHVTSEVGRSIAMLGEHRSALITAAVTGQIEGLR
jgi:type I restriction enzyme S subunit